MVLKEELWLYAGKKDRATAKLNKKVFIDAGSRLDCFDWVGLFFFTVPGFVADEILLFGSKHFHYTYLWGLVHILVIGSVIKLGI
jgi:hypothetical protein